MKTMTRKLMRGFTLIEMMLVMTIVSALIYMSIGYMQQRTLALSIDRASAQMQQILNAGLSYYVNNGSWPASLATLSGGGYLPAAGVISPWGSGVYAVSNTGSLFTVTLSLPALANGNVVAQIIAGKLPLASSVASASCPASPPAPPGCVPTNASVSASVNIPGQNLNNATAVNMTGIYHNGACVPVPKCPVGPAGQVMTPSIMVSPASVSGMSDPGTTNVYPISSFTAYATPQANWTGAAGGPVICPSSGASGVQECRKDTLGGGLLPAGSYWRVCLQVVTEKGSVTWDATTAQYATVIAVTRCAVSNENSGSGMSVWQ